MTTRHVQWSDAGWELVDDEGRCGREEQVHVQSCDCRDGDGEQWRFGGSAVSLMELSTDEAIINIPFSLCPGHVTHLQTLNNTSYSK